MTDGTDRAPFALNLHMSPRTINHHHVQIEGSHCLPPKKTTTDHIHLHEVRSPRSLLILGVHQITFSSFGRREFPTWERTASVGQTSRDKPASDTRFPVSKHQRTVQLVLYFVIHIRHTAITIGPLPQSWTSSAQKWITFTHCRICLDT